MFPEDTIWHKQSVDADGKPIVLIMCGDRQIGILSRAPESDSADNFNGKSFISLSWRRRLIEAIFPSRRRDREARLRAGIRWLIDNPEEPVYFAEGSGWSHKVERVTARGGSAHRE